MKRAVTALLGIIAVASPALATQVRPADCKPIFPVVDQIAEAPPVQDVLAERAGPVATEAKRRFLGLPFWLAGLALAGAGAAAIDDGGGNGRSPD
jgi:hypothetical protein